jgi:hypothetical protein
MTDDEFLAAFEACTLQDFHHRDHVKVAYLYLRRHPLDDAIAKVRTGLQALAAAWGAPVDDLHHAGVGAICPYGAERSRVDAKRR